MPAKSTAQRGQMFRLAKMGKVSMKTAKEFARGTAGMKRRHVKKRR
jgi:hypothetical protein